MTRNGNRLLVSSCFCLLLSSACPTGLAQAAALANRYAVFLADEPVAKRFPSRGEIQSAAGAAWRSRVEAAQSVARLQLAAKNIRVTGSVSTLLNAIFVIAAPGSIADIKTISGVAGVVKLGRSRMLLNRAAVELDGPQAWKSSHSDLKHARMSERQLNTPAKTGLPGMVKPGTYRPFAEFCLDVYDALCRRGWRRLETSEQPSATQSRVLVESYPHAAWKALGIKPLPSKRRARVSDLAEAFAALRALMPIVVNRPPNHDQMQAIVGGLPGLALEERNSAGARIVGTPPRREEGHWREGFIVLPIAPRKPLAVRWLD